MNHCNCITVTSYITLKYKKNEVDRRVLYINSQNRSVDADSSQAKR